MPLASSFGIEIMNGHHFLPLYVFSIFHTGYVLLERKLNWYLEKGYFLLHDLARG